jgi:formiminotetrahydrofolate cyclodeaminase
MADSELPVAGAVAAATVGRAVEVVQQAARVSAPAWEGAAGAAAQASVVRERCSALERADADAYVSAVRTLRDPAGAESNDRDAAIGEALERAAAVPLEIAGAAADAAQLAAEVASRGDPIVRADAAAAALLAEGAGRAAAHLVKINLSVVAEDERRRRAALLVEVMRAASERARAGAV